MCGQLLFFVSSLELSKSLPTNSEECSLTLTRASYLQGKRAHQTRKQLLIQHLLLSHYLGFLSGLSSTRDLPETFYRDRFPCLRPHVQSHYSASDPYSPLGLVVPRELVPPWRDVFVDGHYDIIRGCVLMKSVLQKSRVLQCSWYIQMFFFRLFYFGINESFVETGAGYGHYLIPLVVTHLSSAQPLTPAPTLSGRKDGQVSASVEDHGHIIHLEKKNCFFFLNYRISF